jgi:hypothetical protein
VAQGKPKKWITAQIVKPVLLGKPGIEFIVWDKWGKTRRGTAIVSVGGIRWKGFKGKRWFRISWEKLQEFAEG